MSQNDFGQIDYTRYCLLLLFLFKVACSIFIVVKRKKCLVTSHYNYWKQVGKLTKPTQTKQTAKVFGENLVIQKIMQFGVV